MTATTIELHKYLLSNLGEEKIFELCTIFGNERFSIASIKRSIESKKIRQEVIKRNSVNEVAQLNGVHRSTIYRRLKKNATI